MINLDQNATTPIDPIVLDKMVSVLSLGLGNPSSVHRLGQKAKAVLIAATRSIASLLGVSSSSLVYTSGATEALNMVLKGVFVPRFSGHLITSTLEHVAVYQTAKWLQEQGVEVTFLTPLPGKSAIEPSQVTDAIKSNTRLIALTWANSETGALTDIESIAYNAKQASVPLLVDAVALVGKYPCTLFEGISALCVSGHKIHGPPGVGLLVLPDSLKLSPLLLGGAQQGGLRSGTENLPGIVGFATALELAFKVLPKAQPRMEELRNRFETTLIEQFPAIKRNVSSSRVCNVSNLAFPGYEGELLLMQLDLQGILASHGAACASGSLEPSRVLREIGISSDQARSSLRFSLSRTTTDHDIDQAISVLLNLLSKNQYTPSWTEH